MRRTHLTLAYRPACKLGGLRERDWKRWGSCIVLRQYFCLDGVDDERIRQSSTVEPYERLQAVNKTLQYPVYSFDAALRDLEKLTCVSDGASLMACSIFPP